MFVSAPGRNSLFILFLHLSTLVSLHYKPEPASERDNCETDKGGHKLDLKRKVCVLRLAKLISNWPKETQ